MPAAASDRPGSVQTFAAALREGVSRMQVHACGPRMAFAVAAARQSLHSCCRPCFHATCLEFNLLPLLLPFRVAPRLTPSFLLCHRCTQRRAGATLQPLLLRLLDDEGCMIRLSEPLVFLLLLVSGEGCSTRLLLLLLPQGRSDSTATAAEAASGREARLDCRCCELDDAAVAADALQAV